jgi:hypothetical protein
MPLQGFLEEVPRKPTIAKRLVSRRMGEGKDSLQLLLGVFRQTIIKTSAMKSKY